jgi:hypothetical protein
MKILGRITVTTAVFLWYAALPAQLRSSDPASSEAQSFSNTKTLLITSDDETIDEIILSGKELLGKRYRTPSPNGGILDCGGYVSYIFSQHGIKLPPSSPSIATKIKKIPLKDVKKGDLLFFKGSNRKSKKVGHVSMVIRVDGQDIEMMHSCNRGILTEIYNQSQYYKQRFLFAGRVSLPAKNTEKYNAIAPPDTLPDTLPKLLEEEAAVPINEQDSIPTIKIVGVGDIMLGTDYPNKSYLPPQDGKELLTPVRQILSQADIAFGNLEGVLLSGQGTVKKCSNPEVCYAFKSPDHYAQHLADAGFDVLSVANNHVNDFGPTGTRNTINLLNKAGIHYAGLLECPFSLFEKNGVKYGFAAFSPNKGTIKMQDYEQARSIIEKLDSLSDIVIVSFHGGAEGPDHKHITRQTEMYLGENRGNPYEFARMAIDAGADVVFGHGPHVTRAIDLYKDRFIAYSLGNFATYGRFNLKGPNGLSPIIEVEVDSEGRFVKGQIHSTKQINRGGPLLDERNLALQEIIKLTREDIPECSLQISGDGSIYLKTLPDNGDQ